MTSVGEKRKISAISGDIIKFYKKEKDTPTPNDSQIRIQTDSFGGSKAFGNATKEQVYEEITKGYESRKFKSYYEQRDPKKTCNFHFDVDDNVACKEDFNEVEYLKTIREDLNSHGITAEWKIQSSCGPAIGKYKISYHITIPGIYFETHRHLKQWFKERCSVESNTKQDKNGKNITRMTYSLGSTKIDMSVYCKGAWRFPMCAKQGSSRVLKYTAEKMSFEVFWNLSIHYIAPSARLIEVNIRSKKSCTSVQTFSGDRIGVLTGQEKERFHLRGEFQWAKSYSGGGQYIMATSKDWSCVFTQHTSNRQVVLQGQKIYCCGCDNEWTVSGNEHEVVVSQQRSGNVSFPDEYTKELDSNYMNSLPNYKTQKKYFELFVAKAMRPDPIYIWTSKIKRVDHYGVEYEEYVTQNFDESGLRKALQHIRTNDTAFLAKWFIDPKIRCYNRVDFVPYNGVFDPKQHNTTVYNLFKGYNPLILSPLKDESPEKVLKLFLDITLQLFEGNDRFCNLFLKSRAYRIQNPQRKLPYSFIIIGPQGVGKTLVTDTIGRIVGMDHYYSTTKPNDLFGTHAEGFVHKIFVVMNECEGRDTMDLQGLIKGASTDVEMTVNAKYKRPVRMSNLAQLDITTNKTNPIHIDTSSGDRRFLVSKSTRKYLHHKYNNEFWSRAAALFRSPVFIRCLYDYLNKMEVNIDWKVERKACLTKSYYDMLKLSTPSEVFYFEEMYNKMMDNTIESWGNESPWGQYKPSFIVKIGDELQSGRVRCKKTDLFKRMNNWLRDRGYQSNVSQKKWFNQLTTRLDLPISIGPMRDGYPTVEFDIEKLYKHLIHRRWIGGNDSDLNKEVLEDDRNVVNSFFDF
jgi:hypothetical protein